ncbi:hypothetical protein DL95DRAFT_459804 [Leptodontidium sp. 2 PMI_412]|nr:hypothetical protein DL95DRAFT_459804 [Leptodontidium sp. 2 PMI_412]
MTELDLSSTCKNTRTVKASDSTTSKILSTNKTIAKTMNANMSSTTMAATTTHNSQQFIMPSIDPDSVFIKREPAWLKLDLAVDRSFFSRKRKTLHVVTPSQRQRSEAISQALVARTMSLSTVPATPSTSANGGSVAKTTPESSVTETDRHEESMAPSSGRDQKMIKCRVTGYLRERLLLDDFKDMWDVKDEQRWDAWCAKEKEERGPMQGYEEGDSECEWDEFKMERRERTRRVSPKRRRRG